MSEIANALERIQAAAEKAGLAELSRESGVPYSTVHSFSKRGWKHENLKVLERLDDAAQRLSKRSPPAKGEAAA